MLVTFKAEACSDVTMFGEPALKLLQLMGRTETLPSAAEAAYKTHVLIVWEREDTTLLAIAINRQTTPTGVKAIAPLRAPSSISRNACPVRVARLVH